MARTKEVRPSKSQENKVAAPTVSDPEPEPDDFPELEGDDDDDDVIAVEQQEDEELPGERYDAEDSYHEPEETDDDLLQLPKLAGVARKPQKHVPAKTVVVIDEGDDGEEAEASDDNDPADNANAPPALTEAQRRRQAAATIKRNWGFGSIRECIPEKKWLSRGLKDYEDENWQLDTIDEFEGLSNETQGQGDAMKEQIGLFFDKRGSTGANRRIGGSAVEKEKNLVDDIKRLRKGDRIDPETHREIPATPRGAAAASGPKKKRGKPQSSAKPATKDRSNLGRASKDKPSKRKSDAMADVDDESDDEDNGVQGGGKPSKRPRKDGQQPAEKQSGRQQASDPDSSLRNRIRTLQQQRDALYLIRQNWSIESVLEFLPQRWFEMGEDTDEHIPRAILERIRDLSNITNTPEQGQAVRQALHDSMSPRTSTSLEDILAVIAVAGEQFYAAAEGQRPLHSDNMGTSSNTRVLVRAARIAAARADRDERGNLLRYEDSVLRSAARHREVERLEHIIAQKERDAERESERDDDVEEE
ncbi:uncharacterized protein J4E88_009967 [Alternaria novae-zelandiae]|uniref:uncharacterized protein n=1 Tax=Alternaria novae-zelandiae TaxID=430562 RepID=UPI0020C23244|nr:uncharacterized protein J4E88_009967 [Alternaria novae-zelandiae]KAI4669685.1 hypothetical protein J4E88_009967 [Alternaria novae-zelandiae]